MIDFKIKTKNDAYRLAKVFVNNNSKFNKRYCPDCGADKPFIQLWDEPDSNRIMVLIDTDDSGPVISWFYVRYIDVVNGTEENKCINIAEISYAIWYNRKFINRSGQLDNIDWRDLL